ncbi:MAG: hypothetical protein F6K35_37125 [Okeania sp. SIO2H7]|nr:hypothetical protein [Okeania sp. SIO2H7]
MVSTANEIPTPEALADLKTRVKRLNSRAGQMKMDLHDIAEGLPNDLEKLPTAAAETYEIFQELARLKKQVKEWEKLLK